MKPGNVLWLHSLTQRSHYLCRGWYVIVFLSRHGEGRVVACDASDRLEQRIEAALVDYGGDFRADATRAWGFMHDDDTARLFDRGGDSVFIERPDGAQVDDFDAGAHFLLRLFRGFQRDIDHRAIGEDAHVAAFLHGVRLAQRNRVALLRRFGTE